MRRVATVATNRDASMTSVVSAGDWCRWTLASWRRTRPEVDDVLEADVTRSLTRGKASARLYQSDHVGNISLEN